ncbi:MAG: AMP-dependent synthetase, partial [Pseudomonadales bacterium]|nr:AMP-dependent synthetase [Pseudomonadales bacterium]
MGTNGLQQLSTKVLSRPHHQPAIEYERRWFSWGEFNQVANQVNDLIRESGAEADSKLVLIAKNRPSALA